VAGVQQRKKISKIEVLRVGLRVKNRALGVLSAEELTLVSTPRVCGEDMSLRNTKSQCLIAAMAQTVPVDEVQIVRKRHHPYFHTSHLARSRGEQAGCHQASSRVP
jgi:hypothetical protein